MVFLRSTSSVRWIAVLLATLMGLISVAPRLQAGLIPATDSFGARARAQDLARVQKVLEQKMIRERLKALGFSDREIMDRLQRLSDADLHNLASQMESLKPGGVLGIIIGVLVIILIIVLILHFSEKTVVIS